MCKSIGRKQNASLAPGRTDGFLWYIEIFKMVGDGYESYVIVLLFLFFISTAI